MISGMSSSLVLETSLSSSSMTIIGRLMFDISIESRFSIAIENSGENFELQKKCITAPTNDNTNPKPALRIKKSENSE